MVEKLKTEFKNYFSNGPKAIFICVLILMGIAIPINNAKKTFSVFVDSKEIKMTTFRKTYNEALKANNIIIGSKDKTTIGIDGNIKDKSTLVVKRAVKVEVAVDGKQLEIQSAENTVEDMLLAEGVALNNLDRIVPSKDSYLVNDAKINITRVEEKVIDDVQQLDFSTVVKNDDTSGKGSSKTIQEGQTGEKKTTIKIVYENGKEVSKNVLSEVVTKVPVEKIVAMGTLGVYSNSRGGSMLYTSKIVLRATAYSPYDSGSYKVPGYETVEFTAKGTIAKRNPDGYSTVAVDPNVIPLGSKLYIPGYGYAIAEDTGGAIKGSRIDLYFDTTSECYNFGVRNVDVYILK